MTIIPFLSEAASLAVRVSTIAQDVRGNKDAFMELGNSSGLVYALLVECQNIVDSGGKVSQRLQEDIRQLVENLRNIEKFTVKRVDRGYMARWIYRNKDMKKINRYQEILQHFCRLLAVETQQEELHPEQLKREEEDQERGNLAMSQRIPPGQGERQARPQEEERGEDNERLNVELGNDKRRQEGEEKHHRLGDLGGDGIQMLGRQHQPDGHSPPCHFSTSPSSMTMGSCPSEYARCRYAPSPPMTNFGPVSMSSMSGTSMSLGGRSDSGSVYLNRGVGTQRQLDDHPYPYHLSPSPLPMTTMWPYPPLYPPSPYLWWAPITNFGTISMSNMSGTTMNLGGGSQYVYNFNSGNVTNMDIQDEHCYL